MHARSFSGRAAPSAVLLLSALLACAPLAEHDDPGVDAPADALVVYSGRNESLIGPLLETFESETGIAVEVRYGSTTEMAATLLEEGAYSPADVFLSQDAAALGAVSRAGMLKPLPSDVLHRVDARFRSPAGDWVGVSGRARSIVYNTDRVSLEELPRSLADAADPKHFGRFGVAPTNGSFQAHMAVYRAVHGEEALDTLLAGLVANEPGRYPKNSAIVEAVLAGEVDWGLVNHYYLWRALKETPEAPGANYFPPVGEASGFINAAGAGALSERPEAVRLVAFLLSDEAQHYFAGETYEYPLVASIAPSVELPPLAELVTPALDFGDVSAVFEDTLRQINQSGLVE